MTHHPTRDDDEPKTDSAGRKSNGKILDAIIKTVVIAALGWVGFTLQKNSDDIAVIKQSIARIEARLDAKDHEVAGIADRQKDGLYRLGTLEGRVGILEAKLRP